VRQVIYMRHAIFFLMVLIAASILMAQAAWPGNTASQKVTFQVLPMSEIAVSGNPPPFVIAPATAGKDTYMLQDSSTTYSITTLGAQRKITGKIDAELPRGTKLMVNLAAPSGCASLGEITLTTSPANLVTGIGGRQGKNYPITYTFMATPEAGTVPPSTRTVTFTITD
jgi:hypothetical protein